MRKPHGDLFERLAISRKFNNKFNNLNNNIWFHAVSFGEVKTIFPLVKIFAENYCLDNNKIFLTVSTVTGYELANNIFNNNIFNKNNIEILYFPFDFYFCVKKFFDYIKPEVLIIAETEIWFELLFQARQKNIKSFLVNARVTDKSVKLYNLFFIKNIFNEAIKAFSEIYPQSEIDKTRFLKLGFDSNKIQVLGNLKLDSMQKADENLLQNLKNILNIKNNTFCLIAGSTHEKEEDLILNIYKFLLEKYNNLNNNLDLRLILAPRHPERLKKVENLVKIFDFNLIKRTENKSFKSGEVLLLDTMGELVNFYGVSDLVLLGGTWADIGGHNPLEPVIYNIPVLVGKYTHKIQQISEQLEFSGDLFRAETQEKIQDICQKFIDKKINNNQKINTEKNIIKNNKNILLNTSISELTLRNIQKFK